MGADSVLRFYETHLDNLEAGKYLITTHASGADIDFAVNLFPIIPPHQGVADTNGIVIKASYVYVPFFSQGNECFYSYSIRFSVSAQFAFESVQLTRRKWVITPHDGRSEVVEGPGVVGEYPILRWEIPAVR